MKTITFLGSSLDDLKRFPLSTMRESGYQLNKVQHGFEPDSWKSTSSIGLGVREIRIKDASGIFRIMYIAKFAETVYVLHVFKKKTQKTSQRDIQLAQERLSFIPKK